MSIDTLTISLTGPLAEEVRAAAEARGLTPEDYVRQQIADDLAFEAEYNDLSWDEDLRRLEEPGADVPAEEIFAEIRTRLEARAAPRK
ncbi:MAG: hypothetical protein KJZ75_01430 [Hyphomonadaceae bacterium]|nr:hypothetical protein [Hyphomonadaceae bacterium]GIK50079.1 MAG: hypothetical protein BroJett013_27760 [Alphaproteobacteria bacterium]